MNIYYSYDTGEYIPENDLYALWAEQAEDEADIEQPFQSWLFAQAIQNGGSLHLIGQTYEQEMKVYQLYYCIENDAFYDVMEVYLEYLNHEQLFPTGLRFDRWLAWSDQFYPVVES